MKLIVGLGNPGKEYEKTRHNVGFMAIDKVAEKYNVSFDKNKFNGVYGEFYLNEEKIILLKPQKYMNLSGEVIVDFVNYFKINPEDLLIIVDDMSLDLGNFKLRYKGGSAGHNGLKNIELNLKTSDYKRIKIGISKNNIDMVSYVIGKFKKEELIELEKVIEKIPLIVEDFTKLTYENLMNKYN